ncbi:MAG TPA: class I mannose-6-phosphate isomerase [Terriglobales bacterium]
MSGRWLTPRFQPRIWGSLDLRAWYPERGVEGEPIGEAWLSAPGAPVLVKMLFPRDRLSVQVHPDDAYAAAHGLGRGKSEAWYVIEAAPEARLGVGLVAGATARDLESACREGRGAEMLNWITVAPGEVINIPAGTVHAIGGGVVLLEAQQDSDNTFRLDDYGRGRELHLEHGLAVARATTGGGRVARPASGPILTTPFFTLIEHAMEAEWRIAPATMDRWFADIGRNSPRRGHLLALPAGESCDGADATTFIEVRLGTA